MVFCNKGVLSNFSNFTGKHLSFFNKVAGLTACNFIKKRLRHSCFLTRFVKFLNTYFEEHLQATASILIIHR